MENNIYILSYPKAGRTWLKLILMNYFITKYKLILKKEEHILNTHIIAKMNKNIPDISFTHDLGDKWISWIGNPNDIKIILNDWIDKYIVLLIRDPISILVSSFYHKKYRTTVNDKDNYDGTLEEYVNDEINFERILMYYKTWSAFLQLRRDIKGPCIYYEDLSNKECIISLINKEFGLKISNRAINKAMNNCTFDKMKYYEQLNETSVIQITDDERSKKFREGKQKGYIDQLDTKTIKQLKHKMEFYNFPPIWSRYL